MSFQLMWLESLYDELLCESIFLMLQWITDSSSSLNEERAITVFRIKNCLLGRTTTLKTTIK